jgi:phosphonoacetaldehyde hydrolase
MDVSAKVPRELKAVIFDWAGTVIDFGSRAPVTALRQLFDQHRVPITEAEARADMGLAKRDHIARLLAQPRIAAAWRSSTGAPANQETPSLLVKAIEPAMRQAALEAAELIPGAADLADDLRSAGVKIGSCTGYTREMMEGVVRRAAEQGYRVDCLVCAGETAEGRPSPLMAWKNLVQLGVWPANACIKVDDTAVGIAEGRNAGMWTVGVAASGSGVGLSAGELAILPSKERTALVSAAADRLRAAGADLVIDTVADLAGALPMLAIGTDPSRYPTASARA